MADLKPSDGMVEEAERGLEWRREFGRGGTEVGIARARDIANRKELSPETVNRMVSFFARHEVDKEAEGFRPGEEGYPSNGRIAWALWGGDPGQTWAKRKQRELEKMNDTVIDINKDIIFGKRYEKAFRFEVKQSEELERNGVRVGVIEGFASTWELDRGNDVILKGAFEDTLNRHSAEGRPVRMLLQHNSEELIGGFPIEFAKETDEGLFVRGEINLEVDKGSDAFALVKQGVLTDMSIGFSIGSRDDVEFRREDDDVFRVIKKLELWEISLVSEPMNPGARVMSVKAATPFQDLPLADRSRPWDSDSAIARVRAFTDSVDQPSERYRDAFFWYDPEESESFGSYKLPFADVIDGTLTAIPRGIFAAAAALRGARGGVDIDDREAVIANVERYYQKMGLESPFNEERSFDLTIVETCESIRDVEDLLKLGGFTNEARKSIIRIIKDSGGREDCLDEELDREDLVNLGDLSKKLDGISDGISVKSINAKLDRLIK